MLIYKKYLLSISSLIINVKQTLHSTDQKIQCQVGFTLNYANI